MKIEALVEFWHAGEQIRVGRILDLPDTDARFHIAHHSARQWRAPIKKRKYRSGLSDAITDRHVED